MLTRRAMLMNTAALAATAPRFSHALPLEQNTPTTTLRLQRRVIDVYGRPASVYAIRQPNDAVGLTTKIGARFKVRVENELNEPSILHWHGLTPPWNQDGVPGVTGPIIPPGLATEYDFALPLGGTYWMHSHAGFQEQRLMTAPLIVEDPSFHGDRQQVVVMLSDFSFTPPQEIYQNLTGKKAMEGHSMPAGMEMGHDMTGHMDMNMEMDMDGKMSMSDLNDVNYDAFLANDRTLADPQSVAVELGGRVLLRIINGASMSAFHVDLGEMSGQLVAVDGQAVLPHAGQRFPIACGQRLDVAVDLPKERKAFPIFFVLEGERRQTGIVLAPIGAEIKKISEEASEKSSALDLALEGVLRTAAPLAPRKADRVHTLNLTGDMASYVWSINNIVWQETTRPLELRAGERVELVLNNHTMMAHPMHLHGHNFQVVEIDGVRFSGAVRDTVFVPPHKRVVVAFDANNPGHWAFHCHLLYHMHAGMFATFRYA